MQQQFEMAVAVEIFVGLEEFEEFGSYCTTVVQDKIEGALKTESFQFAEIDGLVDAYTVTAGNLGAEGGLGVFSVLSTSSTSQKN